MKLPRDSYLVLLAACMVMFAQDKPPAPVPPAASATAPKTPDQQIADLKKQVADLRAFIEKDREHQAKNTQMLSAAINACMGEAPQPPQEVK